MRGCPRGLPAAAAVVIAASLLIGCTTAPARPSATDSARQPVLPAAVAVDYQLGGAYEPAGGVGIVTRDSTESPASGIFSICYVNAFQTQPGDAAEWLSERSELVLFDSTGDPLIDDNWPDEMILDTSTPDTRARLSEIVGETITLCAEKGFDAVEFDNLDSWTRSGGALTEADSLAFATLIVAAAHAGGLPAGQKNSAELGERGRDEAGFDFAVAEECASFDECDVYTDVYGGSVINIEYPDNLPVPFAGLCREPTTPPMTVLRDRDLLTPGSEGYVFQTC